MQALVLERKNELSLRDIEVAEELGPLDVRIKLHTVGVCGSDVHYYTHGRIGPFVVNEPMVLGHEAAGTVVEAGHQVKHLARGDRVCMEPGIPEPDSKAARLGIYNLDPAVRFWATPPVHGVLRPDVIHPAAYTFKLPENVSFAEGAMVEPLAVGMHASIKAKITPGDRAVVMGAGPIGFVTAMAARAGGCSDVIVTDVQADKLALAGQLGFIPINVAEQDLREAATALTDGWGVDLVFECSGSPKACAGVFDPLRSGGRVVSVGMPVEPVTWDVVGQQVKEAEVVSVFRYAHVYDRALNLMGSGKIDVKPLISETFDFDASVEAFDRAVEARPKDVKLQIRLS